jgi:(1->4)-alpha-D-glucan 1-alpha-D-glucosylmutase
VPEPPAEVASILRETLAAAQRRRLPESTYRLQFHSEFRFRDAEAIAPYLAELGITDCYSSPYLKARPGSRHGYDIVDHSQLNPEIGDAADHAAWCAALQAQGLGQILDVVPNHMAVVGNDNQWWNDILENGPSSPFANYFDIAWSLSTRAELQGRVLVPILGEPYGKVLESQQLQLRFENGAFSINYFDHRFPITPRSYARILEERIGELESKLDPGSPPLLEYHSVITAIKHLPPWNETDPGKTAEAQREKEVIKRRLAALTSEYAAVNEFLQASLELFNGKAGAPESFDLLEKLLDDQPYRLAYWRVAADEINYRRFFDINELAALNMEREDVFLATHKLIFQLLDEGKVTGLRVDHPDGLFDPGQYLERLQRSYVLGQARAAVEKAGLDREQFREAIAGKDALRINDDAGARWPLYVVVEKILEGDETLPADWATAGTTGYDFLNLVNGLLVAIGHRRAFSRTYHEWTGDYTPFSECAYQQKSLILQIALSGELQMLSHQLDRLAQMKRWSRDFTQHNLRQVLRAIIASFPVYRTYIGAGEVREADAKTVMRAISRGMARNPAVSTSIFNFVRDTLLHRSAEGGPPDPAYQEEQRHFAGKFQQVTAPVMAKGVEDTAFYLHNQLISLNEVGGNPDQFGLTTDELHAAFQQRRRANPWAMSATSTHDTKRSEDVRARLNALSEMPDAWQNCLTRWSGMNRRHRIDIDGALAPDANEEYFLYQTLLGAWPIEPCRPQEYSEFIERIRAYMHKALQEAKVHTSWINPNSTYDEAVDRFIAAILDFERSPEFLADLRAFQSRLSHLGMFNSLAQAVLKIAAPGVPDFYQGTELWDFSLVDPDNRRPVDFDSRKRMLTELRRSAETTGDLSAFADELTAKKNDGRIKMFTTWRALHCRRRFPALFSTGEYESLEAAGSRREHIFGFFRRSPSATAIAVVPRLMADLLDLNPPLGESVWGNTDLILPRETTAGRWRNIFTNEVITGEAAGDQRRLRVAGVLKHFPVAILIQEQG